MRVAFKNIGMVEEADIRLDGLTVIAGENDTGKSTIGKTLFSIIKTFNRFEDDMRDYQVLDIERFIEYSFFKFRESSSNPSILEMGKKFFDELKTEAFAWSLKDHTKEEISKHFSESIAQFSGSLQKIARLDVDLNDISVKISDLITNKPSKEEVLKITFSKYIQSALNGEIANRFSNTDSGFFIEGKEGELSLFQISGEHKSVKLEIKEPLYFKDATFIESPVLLNLADNIRSAKTEFDMDVDVRQKTRMLNQPYAPEYMRDMILKLTKQPVRAQHSPIADDLDRMIHGEFYYDPNLYDFVFKKGDEKFGGVSISPGIKYLGSLKILYQCGFLNNSLLVLDEPETHLHPKWQVQLAELIVKLVEAGNHILLTSHSPYFIEALMEYSDHKSMKYKRAFYFGKAVKPPFTSRIIDVTHDLSPIFEVLAEPFEKLELEQLRDRK